MNETPGPSHHRTATLLGIVAILIWSTVIAFSRRLTEDLGAMTTGACVYLLAGGLGCAYLVARGRLRGALALPRKYLLACGGLMVFYTIVLYAALGACLTRQQVIEAGVINYLWPGLTLVLSVPILRRQANLPLLVLGALLSFAGIALAMTGSGAGSAADWAANLQRGATPYLFALGAGVSWALYSNLSERWGGKSDANAVPIFMLATGLAMAAIRLGVSETSHWSAGAAGELLYVAMLPTLLAYSLWDLAMRRGNGTLLAASANFIPLLATVVSSLALGVLPGPMLWIAAAAVAAGAALSWISIQGPSL